MPCSLAWKCIGNIVFFCRLELHELSAWVVFYSLLLILIVIIIGQLFRGCLIALLFITAVTPFTPWFKILFSKHISASHGVRIVSVSLASLPGPQGSYEPQAPESSAVHACAAH